MAVMVDSHKGRELDEDTVCGGYALWGAERAGDVYISLDYIRQHPKANTSKIALLGVCRTSPNEREILQSLGPRHERS